MTSVQDALGFVLHRYPYGESSFILECLTADWGRVGLVARGARRRGRATPDVAPFVPVSLAWQGRGDLSTLVASEAAGPALPLTGLALWCGFYVNELVLALLARHDPHPGLYRAYRRVLEELAQGMEPHARLRYFERDLLAELGYGLSLEREAADGGPIEPATEYFYAFERGPLARRQSAEPGVPVSGETLLSLARECLIGDRVLREARTLLKEALGRHLRAPLKTPRMLRQMGGVIGGELQ